jgi:GSCFA family
MEWMLKYEPRPNTTLIQHPDGMLLTGSCFTEHIGGSLHELKFNTLQNPNGIIFDTLSVCRSLQSYADNEKTTEKDLFQLHEAWHSWEHHSVFSHPVKETALRQINFRREEAHRFLQTTKWLIITLGSSFAYQLTQAAGFEPGKPVANCHKAPAQWFTKYLIPIAEQQLALETTINRLRTVNPGLQVIFTVSPVRHIRDGVVENNHSKARLLETVHALTQQMSGVYYFPAYELVIDILRDYRFYDTDLVHPNYAATRFVLEKFMQSFVSEAARTIAENIMPLVTAMKHKPFHPESAAHKKFLLAHYEKAKQLQQQYPHLNLAAELACFGNITL